MHPPTVVNGGVWAEKVGEQRDEAGDDIVDVDADVDDMLILFGSGGDCVPLWLLVTSVNPDRVGGLGEKARASLLFESFTVKSLSTGFLALFTPIFRSALLFSLFTAIIMAGNCLTLKDLLSINGLVHRSASDWGNNLATCSLIE